MLSSDVDSHRAHSTTSEPTPCDTPSSTSQQSSSASEVVRSTGEGKMNGQKGDGVNTEEVDRTSSVPPSTRKSQSKQETTKTRDKTKHALKHKKCKGKKILRKKKEEVTSDDTSSSDDDSSSSEDEESESDSSDSSESEEESRRKGRRQSDKHEAKSGMSSKRSRKQKSGKASREKEAETSDSSSESSEEERPTRRHSKKTSSKSKGSKSKRDRSEREEDDQQESTADNSADMSLNIKNLADVLSRLEKVLPKHDDDDSSKRRSKKKSGSKRRQKSKGDGRSSKSKRANKLEYKRVNQLWDDTIHDFRLTDTAEGEDGDEYDEYLFTVQRQFDWKGKYTDTVVNIKSQLLKEVLQGVMEGVQGVSFVEDTPTVDPNLLFSYLEEMRQAMKQLKKKSKSDKKRKSRKQAGLKAAHIKVLVRYLDEDYAETKRTLYPLLESNLITFDYLWALFKPNTIAYTTTYGNTDEPRAFKIDYALKENDFQRGTWYRVSGRYLEYDGKSFGMGTMEVEVPSFKGAAKITTLAAYPLRFHKDESNLRKQLIERGKKFIGLQGMQYRYHQGMAFYKKKRNIIKVNINGRVMVDSAIYRRLNPNYPISPVIEDEDGDEDDGEAGDNDDASCGACHDDSSVAADDDLDELEGGEDSEEGSAYRVRMVVDEHGNSRVETMTKAEADALDQRIDKLDGEKKTQREFTEEELMLASPLVLGFAFSEKLWLEFTISGIKDIEWNVGAFDSLVLPDNQKSIVKALVESHTFHAAQNIEDVIQGKGKGLVAVLHGPPGTGKTLTAEGIAELLRRPLYMVSAGELGTDPRMLEAELNKLLDLSHSWGAVLLLDEADVFLEKRTIHDIHRNALVSIFLRLLEYFQGILFLTTNRVETFDDAFQSRIHVALRYGELTTKAKKTVWKMFIDKVKAKEGLGVVEFKDGDLDDLARNHLNGRQIKNCVRTAQALAVNNNEKLSMAHIRRVLDVVESFDRELKGGTGYVDAMRSYT
ncbi:MAG: hypothetical protein M1823_001706 [Watsoniomyces obsoletus]|nr:MAG: hypothetical protein M1823_001706 [Watsoniomyces obsoletus]